MNFMLVGVTLSEESRFNILLKHFLPVKANNIISSGIHLLIV